MSIQAVAWVLEQYIPKSGPKLVLVSLANHADHTNGRCYPSVEKIAHEASCSVRSVQRYIPYLEEKGFIKVEPNFQDGRQTANTYWLLMSGRRGSSSNMDDGDPSPTNSGEGDSASPLCGRATSNVIPEGDTSGTPINHLNNRQFPPLSPKAEFVEKPKGRHPREDFLRPSSRVVAPSSPKPFNPPLPKPWNNRGSYEFEIMRRLGEDGADILSTIPDWQVNSLCQRQRDGKLDEDAIAKLRAGYLEMKSRASPSQAPQPKEPVQ